jgi:hypothetical protein
MPIRCNDKFEWWRGNDIARCTKVQTRFQMTWTRHLWRLILFNTSNIQFDDIVEIQKNWKGKKSFELVCIITNNLFWTQNFVAWKKIIFKIWKNRFYLTKMLIQLWRITVVTIYARLKLKIKSLKVQLMKKIQKKSKQEGKTLIFRKWMLKKELW